MLVFPSERCYGHTQTLYCFCLTFINYDYMLMCTMTITEDVQINKKGLGVCLDEGTNLKLIMILTIF